MRCRGEVPLAGNERPLGWEGTSHAHLGVTAFQAETTEVQRPVGRKKEGEEEGREDRPKKRCGDAAGSDPGGQGEKFGFSSKVGNDWDFLLRTGLTYILETMLSSGTWEAAQESRPGER